MSHHWDLFVPLICYVANPWLEKKDRLNSNKIHPFHKEDKPKPKPFDRNNWLALKAKIKERKS